MSKLNTHVNVDGTWYGPHDLVPDDVAARIQNPKVWDEPPPSAKAATAESGRADEMAAIRAELDALRKQNADLVEASRAGQQTEPASAEPPKDAGDQIVEPARKGPKSSAAVWAQFLDEQGIEFPDGAPAGELQKLWDDRNQGQ